MSDDPPNKTLARGLNVLEFVLQASEPMRLKDVSDNMKMDMASAHRVLRTLEISGYLARDVAQRTYVPGQKIWTLSQCLPSLDEAFQRLRPILEALTEETGQVAHIGMIDGARVILTDVALTAAARVSVAQAAGDTEDVYCSAIGKTLVAFSTENARDRILASQSFIRHTEFTITARDKLERELDAIRSNRLAFDDREGSLDVSCIAAPICDPSGRAAMAIGISTIAKKLDGSIRDQAAWIEAVGLSAARSERLIAGAVETKGSGTS